MLRRGVFFFILIAVFTMPAMAQYRGQTAFALGPAIVFPTESKADLGLGVHGSLSITFRIAGRWASIRRCSGRGADKID